MIYVGDNPRKDFYIGSIYPIRTVRVCQDGVYENEEYLDGIKETHTVYSLAEIPSVMNMMTKGESGCG
jgi:putative hydrolase of the HAD superfamily